MIRLVYYIPIRVLAKSGGWVAILVCHLSHVY